MIEQQGQVVAINNGRISVRLGGKSGCPACDAGKGCGAGLFGRMLRRKPVTLDFDNSVNALCGEPVVVGLAESLFLRLVMRLYLIPLLAALGGAVAGHYISVMLNTGPAGADILTLSGAVAGGAAVLFRNGRRAAEFSDVSAVHLLRVVGTRNHDSNQEVI